MPADPRPAPLADVLRRCAEIVDAYLDEAGVSQPGAVAKLQALAAEARQAAEREEWIACAERMPEIAPGCCASVAVLAVDEYGARFVAWRGVDGNGGAEWHRHARGYPDPTHWRPLPPPPKGAAP